MATEVEKLFVTLEARLDKYNADLRKGQRITNQQLRGIETRFAKMSGNLQRSAASAAGGIGSIFAGIGAYLSAHAIVDFINEWNRLDRSIQASSQTFGIALKSSKELVALANDARVDVEAYAKTYVRAAAAVRDYGFTSDDAAVATTVLAKALKVGQASASEQASTILQFSQALQKGKLDGDEFRTVMENAGVVQELLAKRLGVTKGVIVTMAREGKLQLKTLIGALLDGAKDINRIFNQMPMTVDEAFAVLRNNVVAYLGDADKATGASQALANSILGVANNIDAIAVAAGAVLGAATLRMAAFAAATTAAANPLSLLAAAIGAIAVAYETMGDKVEFSDDGLVTLKGSVTALFDVLGDREAIDRHIAALATMSEEARKAAQAEEDLRQKAQLEGGGWLIHGDPTSKNNIEAMKEDFIAIDKSLGGIGSKFLAWARDVAGTVSEVTGLGDAIDRIAERARDNALAARAEAVRESGFGGEGFRKYLNSTNRRPVEQLPPKQGKYDRQVSQIRRRTEELKAQIATIDQTTFAQEKARASADLMFAAQQSATKNGTRVSEAQKREIDAIADAYANAAVQAKFLGQLSSAKEDVIASRSEISLIGLYGEALDAARIKLDLLNEARRLGVQITPWQEKEIEETAEAKAALDEYLRKVQELQDISKDALSGFLNDLREGKSLAESFAGVLDKLASKLIESGVDKFITSASGALLGEGSGFASLFGFADGGVFVPGKGPQKLKTFAGGGVSNQAAIFGEAGPEAAIPLKNGKVPVELRMPKLDTTAQASGGTVLNFAPVINAQNATPQAVDKLNAETIPMLRKIAKEVTLQTMSRSASAKRLMRGA